MWFTVVEVEQETSAPLLKKNPGSTPDTFKILKFISKYQLLFQWKNFEKYNYDLLYSALKQVKQNS